MFAGTPLYLEDFLARPRSISEYAISTTDFFGSRNSIPSNAFACKDTVHIDMPEQVSCYLLNEQRSRTALRNLLEHKERGVFCCKNSLSVFDSKIPLDTERKKPTKCVYLMRMLETI